MPINGLNYYILYAENLACILQFDSLNNFMRSCVYIHTYTQTHLYTFIVE